MKKNHLILGATLLAVVAAIAWRSQRTPAPGAPDIAPELIASGDSSARAETPAPRPRLIELGSDECVSCKAMIPVLAELREENGEALAVDFIDVWKFPDLADPFDALMIPTQIFQAPDGTELARHEGFIAADEIRKRFLELGYPVVAAADEK